MLVAPQRLPIRDTDRLVRYCSSLLTPPSANIVTLLSSPLQSANMVTIHATTPPRTLAPTVSKTPTA